VIRRGWLGRLGAHLAIGLLWLLHWLPLPLLAAVGQGLGALLWWLGRSRQKVALRNLELCFPEWDEPQRRRVARAHFGWLGRSLLERGLLWYASPARLARLVHTTGDVGLADRTPGAMMWLLPHFAGLEWMMPGMTFAQKRRGFVIYQRQRNPTFEAALKAGRDRLGGATFIDRHAGIRPILRAVRDGYAYINALDMDFGPKDSAFVPFFGVPAATLLSPGRMAHDLAMTVQPIEVTMLPGGQGYRVHCHDPIPGYGSGDALADAQAFNAWLEARIRAQPEQYLWVHRRFKTRPPGQASVYR